jgi:hypothetical protein
VCDTQITKIIETGKFNDVRIPVFNGKLPVLVICIAIHGAFLLSKKIQNTIVWFFSYLAVLLILLIFGGNIMLVEKFQATTPNGLYNFTVASIPAYTVIRCPTMLHDSCRSLPRQQGNHGHLSKLL